MVTRAIRDDFIDFYTKEITKAKKMGMQLARAEMDEKGQPTMKASDKFISIMRSYFEDLATGKRKIKMNGKSVDLENIDRDETPDLDDEASVS